MTKLFMATNALLLTACSMSDESSATPSATDDALDMQATVAVKLGSLESHGLVRLGGLDRRIGGRCDETGLCVTGFAVGYYLGESIEGPKLWFCAQPCAEGTTKRDLADEASWDCEKLNG